MNENFRVPRGYKPLLDVQQTERAIKLIKDYFERSLSAELRLFRVTSPLFVPKGSGINDDLNGIEQPVQFAVTSLGGRTMEIVQSLAKWKRMALADYGYSQGTGIYTDMNALRPDDQVDQIHSVYVDQWDWELVISPQDRSETLLETIVRSIYQSIRRTEFVVHEQYPQIELILPPEITFISSSEALERFPDLSPEQREKQLAKEYKAVFISRIGWPLSDGRPHGGRAPDYDDWSLNGDILVWDALRQDSLELSSMGIRVDIPALEKQLHHSGQEHRKDLYWHMRLIAGDFPQTIGGGIGQSRLCMFLLRKAHIGEVQAGVWPELQVQALSEMGVTLM